MGIEEHKFPPFFTLKANQYIYGVIPNVYTKMAPISTEEDENSLFYPKTL